MVMKKEKHRAFEVDRDERNERRRALSRVKRVNCMMNPEDGRMVEKRTD